MALHDDYLIFRANLIGFKMEQVDTGVKQGVDNVMFGRVRWIFSWSRLNIWGMYFKKQKIQN